jgi:chromosome segregation ATPase
MSECNDPDHSAINAERQETRGLRKAWIELDDKRQYLEKQLHEATKQRDALAEALESLCTAIISGHPREITGLLKQSGLALAATKGGSHATLQR